MNNLIKLSKSFIFEASHQLMRHDGKCAKLHGHSWGVTITVIGHAGQLQTFGPKENMLTDYADLKRPMKDIIEQYLDHHHLNDTLEVDMPTSEYLALWLFDRLKKHLPNLYSVKVNETCTSECELIDHSRIGPLLMGSGPYPNQLI